MSTEIDTQSPGSPVGDTSCSTLLIVAEQDVDDLNACTSSSLSSSIGRNSDLCSDGEDSGENEVQSSYRGSLDVMDALEEALPIRRGISNFYSGKSKSFTSLAEASCTSSIKEIAKPENAYLRKRRNILAYNHVWEKNRNLRSYMGGISKRPLGSSRSTLAFAVAMSSSDSISGSSEDSNSRSPTILPPLHPQSTTAKDSRASPRQQNLAAWRSFSFVDLQQCATTATASYQLLRNADFPN